MRPLDSDFVVRVRLAEHVSQHHTEQVFETEAVGVIGETLRKGGFEVLKVETLEYRTHMQEVAEEVGFDIDVGLEHPVTIYGCGEWAYGGDTGRVGGRDLYSLAKFLTRRRRRSQS